MSGPVSRSGPRSKSYFGKAAGWRRFEDEPAAPALIVTPAKAGVQLTTGTFPDEWIPAFAGMTGVERATLLRYLAARKTHSLPLPVLSLRRRP